MNELKKCPFCGGRVAMNQDYEGFYVSCVEEDCVVMTNSYAEKEAVEKWNTRKPIERVIERLEKEKGIAFLTLANTGDSKYDFAYDYVMAYIDKAIEIIKEEV